MLLPEIEITDADLRNVRAHQKRRHNAFAASEPEPMRHKPRWLKGAKQGKGAFAPEMDRPGTRFTPPVRRGCGPTKRFAAN